MLVIRKEQMAAFFEEAKKGYPKKIVHYLNEKLPEQTSALSEEDMGKRVAESIERAATYDIEVEWDLHRFTYLDFLYGPKFDEECAWAQDILAEQGISPTVKVNRLELYHLNYLKP